MSQTPLVSVCLPSFNGAVYLDAALESILSQTYENFELLVSDDNSEDDTYSIISKYAKQDKRIKFWQNKTRLGLFNNYNRTIEIAEGKYIKPFAQDDLLARNALECFVNVLENNLDVNLVSSKRRIIDLNANELKIKGLPSVDRKIPAKEVITFNLISLENWVGEPSAVMFHSNKKGRGFDTRYFHYGDIEYWFRVLDNSNYYFVQEALCSFRWHENSQTSKNHKNLLFALDILQLSLDYRHVLSDIETEEHFRKRIIEKIAVDSRFIFGRENENINLASFVELFQNFAKVEISQSQEEMRQKEGFRLLSAYALSVVCELVAELDHEKRCRFDEHERFVSEVNKMRNSVYWRLSEPFRKFKNTFSNKFN